MQWVWRKFEELTNYELYDVLALREKVFLIEQQCDEPDLDYHDQNALHLLGMENNKLVAYLRLFLPGTRYANEISWGRLLTDVSARNRGLARIAIQEIEKVIPPKFQKYPTQISAQIYLQTFYESLGFEKMGEPYDEAGIIHIKMRKTPA